MSQNYADFFIELMDAWRQSWSALSPKEIKVTALLTLNTLVLAVRALLLQGLPGVLAALGVAVLIGILVPGLGLVVIALLFMRSSVGIKDREYAQEKLTSPAFLLTLLAITLLDIVWGGLSLALCPLLVLWLLFVFDAPPVAGNCLVTLWAAARMLLYNLPFIMVLYALAWWAVMPLITLLIGENIVQTCIKFMIMPFYVAGMVFGYTIELRRNFGRYY